MTEQTNRIKAADLNGDALDWAVATALGGVWKKHRFATNHDAPLWDAWVFPDGSAYSAFRPSRNWADGGPLIQRFHMSFFQVCIGRHHSSGELRYKTQAIIGKRWTITGNNAYGDCYEHQFLRAASRAIVHAFIGEIVNAPTHLLPLWAALAQAEQQRDWETYARLRDELFSTGTGHD